MKEPTWFGVTYYRPSRAGPGVWTFFVHTTDELAALRIAERTLNESLNELLIGVSEVTNPDQKISLTKRVGNKENAYLHVKGESVN